MKTVTVRCVPLSELVKLFPVLDDLAEFEPPFTWGDTEYTLLHPQRLIDAIRGDDDCKDCCEYIRNTFTFTNEGEWDTEDPQVYIDLEG